jgi:surface protein
MSLMSWAQNRADGTAEPYAVLKGDTLLTFYYDDQKATRNGMDIGPFSSATARGWHSARETITSVVFDDSFANYDALTSMNMWFYNLTHLTSVTGISNLNTANVTSFRSTFSGCSSLTSLDLSSLNTSKVMEMNFMFEGCSSLTDLKVGFSTESVTTMANMFLGCSSLTTLDLSTFNTSSVKSSMDYMFSSCSALTTIYVSDLWTTTNVTTGNEMFNACQNLVGGQGTSFSTSHRGLDYAHIDGGENNPGYFTDKNAAGTFDIRVSVYGNGEVSVGNLPDVIVDGKSAVASVDAGGSLEMFFFPLDGYQIGSVVLDNNDVTAFVMPATEYSAASYILNDINASHDITVTFTAKEGSGVVAPEFRFEGDNLTMSTTTQNASIFYKMAELASMDEAYVDSVKNSLVVTADAIHSTYYEQPFELKKNAVVKAIAVMDGPSGMVVSDTTTMVYDYEAWLNLKAAVKSGVDLYDRAKGNPNVDAQLLEDLQWALNEGDMIYNQRAQMDRFEATHFTLRINELCAQIEAQMAAEDKPYAVLSTDGLTVTFYYDTQKNARGGIEINNSYLQENVPSPYGTATTAVFDASFANYRPVSTAHWFQHCRSLTSITNIEYLNTVNVTEMTAMFHKCSSLPSLDLSNFNTSNVTDMTTMFGDCSGLTSLDLSNFNTTNVTGMNGMFAGCSGLTNIDLSNFNTTNVMDMSLMFHSCSGLTSLDLSNFNTAKVTNMESMFRYCSELKTIYIGNEWSTNAVEFGSEMFDGCTNLVGGAGTVYDANHTDHTYAHIDGGENNPGYFTDKNPVEASYYDHVLYVGGSVTLAEAMQKFGTNNVVETIAAIVWNSSQAISTSELQVITNPNLLIYVQDASLAPANRDNVVINGFAKNVVLSDVTSGNNNFYCPEEFTAEAISYTRNFQQQTEIGISRGWESIALPFDVQTIMHEKNGVLSPFGSSEGGKPFWLRQLSDNGLVQAIEIHANRPYLISMPNCTEYPAEFNQPGRVTFSSLNVRVPVTEEETVAMADSTIVLIPTFQRMEQSDWIYALNVGETRAQYPEGSVFEQGLRAVRPFEAFTVHNNNQSNPAPRYIAINEIGNGTTGIENIVIKDVNALGDRWYSLDGRLLQGKPAQKGIYIHNGKKKIIK